MLPRWTLEKLFVSNFEINDACAKFDVLSELLLKCFDHVFVITLAN